MVNLFSSFPAVDPETWIGLTNPNGVDCDSKSACDGDLYWIDNTAFVGTAAPQIVDIESDDGDEDDVFGYVFRGQGTTGTRGSLKARKGDSTQSHSYICEILCP